MKLVAELFLHFKDGDFIALRAFDGDEAPTLGKVFDDSDSVSWTFGRKREWCDVVWSDPISAIHFTIFYDRTVGGKDSLGEWLIQDGGFYPTPLKMVVPPGEAVPAHYSDEPRDIGWRPSTLGTFVNGDRLSYRQPTEDKPAAPMRRLLYPGDRIFAAGKKMFITDSARQPVMNWHVKWEDTGEIKDDTELITPKQVQDLSAEQQKKVEAVPTTGGPLVMALVLLGKRLDQEPAPVRLFLYSLAGLGLALMIFLAMGAAR